ncbi:MAG TPA: GTP-binding protein [Vitreimonas sp.]|nr:GTP-binding protein [Vitreimonas sp.]
MTGFLGSGKTTIILSLIDQLQRRGEQVVYIKNEIGSENIDGQLAQNKTVQTTELLNGCICCTLVGPFISAIDELMLQHQPDRIIIEASGAAEPSAIALMVSSHARLTRDGVISIIDVENFEGYKDISFTAQQQAKFTDLILLNKVELVDDDRKRAVVGYIRELNASSPILEAPHGQISPAVVFGLHPAEITSHPPEHVHTADEHEDIDTLTITVAEPPSLTSLRTALGALPKAVFRVKGILSINTGEVMLINKVGTRIEISPLEDQDIHSTSKLVLIGFRLQDQQENILSSLRPHLALAQ